MAGEEIDLIQHLLDVEREASITTLDAQKQADEIIAKAHSEADEKFKVEYSKAVKAIEAAEEKARLKLQKKHEVQLESYKKSLNENQKELESFFALMDENLSA